MSRLSTIHLWKIENKFSELDVLLHRNYIWKNRNNIECKNSWINIQNTDDFTTINGQTLHYLVASSCIEEPVVSDPEVLRSLPEKSRTKSEISTVFFIEKDENIICLVECSTGSGAKIRNRLMKSHEEAISWNNIEFRNIAGYECSSNFYYWLLSVKDIELKSEDNTIIVHQIEGFQSSNNRTNSGEIPSDYIGSGSEIDKRIPFQSIVSVNQNLTSLHINLLFNDLTVDFSINSDYSVQVNYPNCGNFTQKDLQLFDKHYFILNIYHEIIPTLMALYRKAENEGWNTSEVLSFRKKTAITVILDLMDINNIDFQELQREKMSQKQKL